MFNIKKYSLVFILLYALLLIIGIKTLFHGFPDIERFFAEWRDERLTLTYIMKFGTLNFAPTERMHPPLYHYLTFIPIAVFFMVGKLAGFFSDKADFVRFYFNNTHYFFLIGRTMSFVFYWLSAIMIFKITRLFYNRTVSHITTFSYLLIPRFIFDFSTTRPDTLLFLTTSIFFYFFLRFHLNKEKRKYLFLAAFFLGVSMATKFNAIYLGFGFVPLFVIGGVKTLRHRNYKEFSDLWLKAVFFIFLGFFICHPFFLINLSTSVHNLKVFNTEMKYYWRGDFGPNHLTQLISLMYVNFFGFLILLFGCWRFFKKDKRLFTSVFFTILVYEIYFGMYLKNYSPLYFVNPLVPLVAFIFSTGVDFIIMQKRKLIPILIMFGVILSYNYLDIWRDLSWGQTHIQKARAFIEESVPEFTTICITSNGYLPQLNMTKESYYRLIETAPSGKDIKGHELTYESLDNEERYPSVFKELRVESLMKEPQYNLIRWDGNIKTEKDAIEFLKKNNIEYIVSNSQVRIDNKKLEDTKMASLVKEFKPNNKRIYETVYADISLYLYRVN